MSEEGKLIAYAAILTWVMIMTASGIRTRGNFGLAFSNRDAMPTQSPISQRADRAAANMIENMALFITCYVAAKAAGAHGWKVERGLQIFVAARTMYFPIYLMGVRVVRTLIWFVACGGMALLVYAALTT